MILSPHKEEKLAMNVFLSFLALLLLGCTLFFRRVIINAEFNLFPIVASTILISLFPLIKENVLRREIYKLFALATVVVLFDVIESISPWVKVVTFNFYGIMYAMFFYCYLRQLNISNKVLQGYIYVINFFLFFYFLLVNGEVLISSFFYDVLYNHVLFIGLGIKVIMLFISLLTLVSLSFHQIEMGRKLPQDELQDMDVAEETVSLQVDERDLIIVDQIKHFFENNKAYLDMGFSLDDLCRALFINNPQIVSKIIKTHFDTTFYKLLAKYRISYAQTLLQSEEHWTLDAISNSCGFRSINTFNKYFMDYVGLSPYLYRTKSL